MNEIEVVFTYSRQEFIRAMRGYFMKRLFFVFDIIISAALLVLGVSFLMINGPSIFNIGMIAAGSMVLMILFAGIVLMPVINYSHF